MARRVPLFVGYSNFGATPQGWCGAAQDPVTPGRACGCCVLGLVPVPLCAGMCARAGAPSASAGVALRPLGCGLGGAEAEQEQGWDSERAAGVEKYWAVPAVCRVPLATRALLKWVPPHPRRGWGSSPASCNSARCCAPERGVLAANPGAGARYPLRAAKRGIQQVLPVPPPSNVCTKAEPGLGVGGGSSSSLSSPLPCLPRAADFHLWELCKGSR